MPVPAAAIDAAIASADAAFPATIERLKSLIRIPSCSFPGFDHAHVESSAQATAQWLRDAGYPEVRVARLPGVLPYVIAKDHRAGPGQPTLLLYAHHDVQPPLREEAWRTPPFEPIEKDGRLYARGAADDKAGIACHAACAAAWTAVAGRPPVNLTVLIEGEEEVGSHHLGAFVDANLAELAADALVIADLANWDTGLPSLTTSLRGLVAVEVELRALKSPLHSGMWGGIVPDPAAALCRLISTLTDADGRLIAALRSGVRVPTADELAGFRRLPYDAALLGSQAGLLVASAPADAGEALTRLWREPAFSVNAIQAGQRGRTGNVIMDAAWARLGIRIVPDQQPEAVRDVLMAHLRRHAPAGMELVITQASLGAPWATVPDHPIFATARAALERGFGRAPVTIGCGASIPFVGEMTAKLGGIPALLLGVEDPVCGAHAENESVHLGDLRSAIRAQTALVGMLAR